MRHLLVAVLGFVLIAPATSARALPTRFDAGHYRNFTCQQLAEEGRKVSARAVALSGEAGNGRPTNFESTEDVVVMPKVVSDRKSVFNEFALLKQQMLAIEDASIQSQCQIEFLDKVN